jgi:hypothetical protein
MRLLEDPEWQKWSDAEIARRCVVSHDFTNRIRKEMAPLTIFKDSEPEPRTYINKHGTVSTMDTSRIGRSQSQAPYYSPSEAYPESLSPVESLRQSSAYQDDQANGFIWTQLNR